MIIVNLDVQLAKKKMKLGELADIIGITNANLSILKMGKARLSALAPSMLSVRPLIASPETS